jgi:hypothetical protein
MPTYSVPSSVQSLTVLTQLNAPRFSQETCHAFLKGAKAREFARELRYSTVESVLMLILGLPNPYPAIYAGVFALYRQSIIDKIVDYSDKFPGVYVKVIKSTYGTFFAVEPWVNTSKATISLTNTDTATEKVVN